MRFTHCGKMIIEIVWRRVKASEAADSHWPDGIDWTAPRTISETLAITGSAKPKVALIQSGTGMVLPKIVNWNGSRYMQKKRSTSQGAWRKKWVTSQAARRIGAWSEIWARPRKTPAAVPPAMAS